MKTLLLIFFLFANAFVFAQTKDSIQKTVSDTLEEPVLYVEHMPEYPGGDNAMYKFLAKRIKYPSEERKQNHEGKVIVQFIVETDGSLSDVKILKRSPYSGLDEEALRVVKTLPAFKPGKQNGKAARVYFQLPIVFTLH